MIIDIRVDVIKTAKLDSINVVNEGLRYKKDNQRHPVDLRILSESQLSAVEEAVEKHKGANHKITLQHIETFRLLKANPSGIKVNTALNLASALIDYIMPSERKWLFELSDDGNRLAWYVSSIQFIKAKRDGKYVTPAHVVMSLTADGQEESRTFWPDDFVHGITAPAALKDKRLYIESPQLVKEYEAEIKRWHEVTDQVGAQFSAIGTGDILNDDRYGRSYETISLVREGQPARVVMDDGSEQDRRRRSRASGGVASIKFWIAAGADIKNMVDGDDDDDDDEGTYASKRSSGRYREETLKEGDPVASLPVHPWCTVFDLVNHDFLSVHVNQLEPWKYDKTVGKKLILPADTMELITALVEDTGGHMEDIITGKTGGTVIISTGPPGTGKTLTAEVCSETMERALYTVQCSQLGVTAEELETRLKTILARATRWNAILLIDEADVYVRQRGKEVVQNAIVGVWLRVLEYYRGLLFLTSNKGTAIDDAVMSRATAWVRYDTPTPEDLRKIWDVLGKQYDLKLDRKLIDELADNWPKATGRNVKNMIKLAKKLGGKAAKVNLGLFESAARFLDVPVSKASLNPARGKPGNVVAEEQS